MRSNYFINCRQTLLTIALLILRHNEKLRITIVKARWINCQYILQYVDFIFSSFLFFKHLVSSQCKYHLIMQRLRHFGPFDFLGNDFSVDTDVRIQGARYPLLITE